MLFFIPIAHTILLADYFTIIKRGLFFFSAALAAFLLVKGKTIWLPKIKSLFFLLFGLLVLLRLFSVVRNFSAVSIRSSFESLGFIVLTLFFLKIFQEKKTETFKRMFMPLILGLTIIIFHTLFQIYNCRFIELNLGAGCFASFFGNINMLEEYLILTLPLLIYYWINHDKKLLHLLLGVLFSVTVFVIWNGQSRSALIGLGVLLTSFLFLDQFRKREAVYFVLSAVMIMASIIWTPVSGSIDKESSKNLRMELLKGSMDYLKDVPWGDGLGSFEYGYTPYQKFTNDKPDPAQVYLNPHNEILRWGIEGGWLFLFALFVLFSAMSVKLARLKSSENFKPFLIGLGIVIGPQLLFQFPMDNGFSVFWLSLALGLFLSFFNVQKVQFPLASIKVVFTICGLALIFFAATYLIANHLEFYYHDDLDKTKIACKLDPANWSACSDQIENNLNSHNLEVALFLTKSELRKRPFNFVALKYLMIIQLEMNLKKEGCQTGFAFQQIFDNRSALENFLSTECSDVVHPNINLFSASAYKESYLKWLNEQIYLPNE